MGVKRETLKSGRVLKALIEQFENNRTKENLIPVLHCLRDSFVWIPGTLRMSDTDAEKFLNSQAGDTVTTDEVMKFEPDILQNGEDKFYPVFSSIEEMGEYGNNFSKVEKHFFEAMSYANGKPETVGILRQEKKRSTHGSVNTQFLQVEVRDTIRIIFLICEWILLLIRLSSR